MASLNKVMIIGNLGADPEARYTANGDMVVNFNVATNESWTDQSGERRERTEWFSVVAWRKTGEFVAEHASKGSSVYVEGRLQTRSWEQDGQKKYRTEVIANEVKILGGWADGGREPVDVSGETPW